MARPIIRALALAVALATATVGSLHGQGQALTSDSALVRYLRRTDSFFRQFGPCRDAKLVRSNARVEAHGDTIVEHKFSYAATCESKDEGDSDCLYDVQFSGTVDTPNSATIRSFRWELECGGRDAPRPNQRLKLPPPGPASLPLHPHRTPMLHPS